jgi:hypothetical protein
MSKKRNQAIPAKAQIQTKTPIQKNESKQIFVELPPVSYHWLLAAMVGIVGVLLYANTYQHGYVIDDQVAITLNQNVQKGIDGISGIFKQDFWEFLNQKSGYYRPLPLATFAIEHEFFGNNPTVNHIGNIILYGFTGFFVFILLQRWFRKTNPILLFLIALLFISHPLHTEVVANIKSRDEILSTLFLIITLFTFDIYFDTKQIKYLIISLISMYLAYLSKESSIIGLGIIGLVAYTFKQLSIGKSILQIVPYFIVTLLFFFQKNAALGSLGGDLEKNLTVYPYFIEKTQFLSTFKLFFYYIKMCFFPHPLIHDYSYNQIPSGSLSDGSTLAGLVLFGGILFLIFKYLKERNYLFFGLTFFIFTIFPALAFTLMRGGIFAERFLYFPLLGFSILIVLGLDSLIKSPQETNNISEFLKAKPMIPILFLVVIALFSFRTISRNPAWKSEFLLTEADFPYAQENAMMQLHYGNSYNEKYAKEKNQELKTEYRQKAFTSYRKAIKLSNIGEAYFGIGRLYELNKQLDSAKYYYRETIRLMPNYVLAYNNMGVVFNGMGRFVAASYYFNIATRVNPNYQPAQSNKAAYLKKGLDIQVLPDSLKQEEVPALQKQFNLNQINL